MFEIYKNQVIEAYRNRCAKSELSNNLAHPTAAKLKRECLNIYLSRVNTNHDTRILSDFFGKEDVRGNFLSLIKHIDVDKFKPLNNFLHGRTTDPDSKHVELLAWLIDFHSRPYKFEEYKELPILPSNQQQDPDPEFQEDRIIGHLGTSEDKKIKPFFIFRKWILPMVGFVLLLLIGGFFIYGDSKSDKECMYWTTDHYEAAACDKKVYGKQNIALDTLMLLHFKKITTPDTITEKSLGKIWYVKANGKLEFFTANGRHPVDPTKILRPITSYVIEKYCNNQTTKYPKN